MSGENDLLAKFRNNETDEHHWNNSKLDIVSYLINNVEDLSKNSIIDALLAKANEESEFVNSKRIKRTGNDANDIKYFFGKIHGLENIAYLTQEQFDSVSNNPVALQWLVNSVVPPIAPAASYEEYIQKFNEQLKDYKSAVYSHTLEKSDRMKLLALPFYLMKRR